MYAVCRRITGSDADAADAAQEALISIVRSLHAFDGRSSLATWIYRIATNASLDELRRRRRRPSTTAGFDDGAGSTKEAADPDAQLRIEAFPDRLAIDAALANLPEEFRVPVVLRDVADLDYAEIAVLLGVPLGTVKSRIARGRHALVRVLGGTDGNRDRHSERPRSAP